MARSILISVLLAIVYKGIYVLSVSSVEAPNWVLEGDTITLFCGVNPKKRYEDPECVELEFIQWWMYDDNGLPEQIENQDSTSKIFIQPVDTRKLNGQRLIIKDFNESNERDYWCVVQCYNGPQYVDDIRLLRANKPGPHSLIWPHDPVERIKKNWGITLSCQLKITDTDHYSSVKYWAWHRKTLDLENTRISEETYPSGKIEITTTKHPYYNKQLTINNLEDSDEQSYLCYVSYVTSQGEEAREISKISLHVS